MTEQPYRVKKRYIFGGLGAVVLGILAVIVLVAGVWAITVAWAPWKGAGEQRKQILGSGTYRIAAYNHFFDLCASAQTTQQNIKVTKKAIKQAPTAEEKYRQQTNLQAQTNQLNELVNQYNADAHKADTLAHFQASELPFTLYATQEIQCAA